MKPEATIGFRAASESITSGQARAAAATAFAAFAAVCLTAFGNGFTAFVSQAASRVYTYTGVSTCVYIARIGLTAFGNGFTAFGGSVRVAIKYQVAAEVAGAACGRCGVWPVRRVAGAACGRCGVWPVLRRTYREMDSVSRPHPSPTSLAHIPRKDAPEGCRRSRALAKQGTGIIGRVSRHWRSRAVS